MQAAHKHLNLKEEDFNAIAENQIATLTELEVPKELIDQIIAVVAATKNDALGNWVSTTKLSLALSSISSTLFEKLMVNRFYNLLRDDVATTRQHWRDHGFKATLSWLHAHDAPTTFQFLKYSLSGAVSTIIQLGIFLWLSHTFFPAHDYLVEGEIPDQLKERNAIICNLIAFPFSNLSAYLLNVWFVFTPGRHSKRVEFLLFTTISLISFGAGVLGGPLLISRGLNPWIAQFGFMITSAIVNFACRKFLIFQK